MNEIKITDQLLCEKFPRLYRNRYGDMRTTAMCWGFEVGPGWMKLIYDLSEELEKEIIKLEKKWTKEDLENVCAFQVKEKYGTLRYYMDRSTDEMYWLISEYESKSSTICEQCGEPGKLRGSYWLYTACDKHSQEEDQPITEKYYNLLQKLESFYSRVKYNFSLLFKLWYLKRLPNDILYNCRYKIWKMKRKVKKFLLK